MLSPFIQSVISLFADPGVVSLILALPHTLVEIDFEIFSTVILLLPPIQKAWVKVQNFKNPELSPMLRS